MDKSTLKAQVYEHWNAAACQTWNAVSEKFSREYFEEIEKYRYEQDEPEIHAFAQFTRYHGKSVLEVGVGAGTDFIQWARAGAKAVGIDLTSEAVENTRRRLEVYGFSGEVSQADAEALPFADKSFDLVYSYGVIHHTPDTMKALAELIRVAKPDGEIKLMLYNRHSTLALLHWVRWALLCGKPHKSISWALWNHMESLGTKAYTRREIERELSIHPVTVQEINTRLCKRDLVHKRWTVRTAAYLLSFLIGLNRCGWNMNITLRKAKV
jgi:ubiquinone/menaquinone biosynthesis C-methylase UbiE